MPLSVAIITHNAGALLEACLKSVSFADEIVVVDSDSTDGTVELAQRLGARVVHKEWLGFGPQKQFAVGAAAHDWVLCLDADERVSEVLRVAILAELRAPRAAVYAMPRCNRFLGRWLRHGEGYPDWSVRLFDRRQARWSDDPVHEKVIAAAPAQRLAGDLLHDSAQTLDAYLEKQNRYTSLQARTLNAQGRRAGAWHLVLAPLARFIKFYVLRLGFLDGVPGLVHVCIGCMNSFNKYAKLIALQRPPPE
ncbi:MAG: benzoate transporter [Betaproteobacteria bacterium RIFCSPLOWO2_02_FULL_65_20]|nr:MAG: benzoate transporter [Betaproteobacteria bacterium RIFCSPLOWO2_02_FULL_65_20]